MLWLLAGVALCAIVILIVGGLTSSLHVEDMGSAFLAALGMTVLAWLTAGPIGYLESAIASPMSESPNVYRIAVLFLGFLTNTLLFSAVALFVPGISVRGGRGLALVGAALTVVDWLLPLLVMTLARIDS